MKVVKCASCGAPFSDVPEDTAVRCAFCGVLNQPTLIRRPDAAGEDEAREVRVVIDARPLRRTAGAFTGFVALFVVLSILASVGGSLWAVWSGLRGQFPGKLPHLPGTKSWTLANLREFDGLGRHALDVPPPAGGFARFDPVGELPWAQRIAQAWQADAQLERIDAERIRPEGVLDLASDPDAEVRYRFVSPARVAHYWKLADEQDDVKVGHEFWVIAKGGGIAGQMLTTRPSRDAAPPAPRVLPLATLLDRAKRRLPARPFYKGYLIHSTEGWVWYLSSLSGRDSLPRVRARDGRVWPY
jgi:hypothetical protein